MASDSILSLRVEENQWVLQISQLLHRTDFPTAFNSPPFIFRLTDSVHNQNPDLYLPLRIALGPYHHFRPQLYNMEFYKLKGANEVRTELQLTELTQLADHLLQLNPRIRTCFDNHLEIGDQTLALMLMVDGLFLLRFMAKFLSQRNRKCTFPRFDDRNLFHSDDQRLVAHYEILRDVLKLENQIPILVFKEILPSDLTAKLPSFLYALFVGISPFELPEVFKSPADYLPRDLSSPPASPPEFIPYPEISFPYFHQILDQSHHLLHFIYFTLLIIPKFSSGAQKSLFRPSDMSQTLTIFQKFLSIGSSVVNIAFLSQLNAAIDLIRRLFELLGVVRKLSSAQEIPPVIPSASQLQKVDVKFNKTKSGILEARFRKDSATLELPVISVNAFTEVLLGNLVALEAMAEIKPPCFAEYVDLMSGLIASSKDVEILKEAKILISDRRSDEEVVKLFNGVRASIPGLKALKPKKPHGYEEEAKETSSSEVEKGVLEEMVKRGYENGLKVMGGEVNGYYGSCRRVKAERFMRKYVGTAVAIMAVLVIVFLMFLVIARLVCSFMFTCPKFFKNSVAGADAIGFRYV